MLMRRSRKFDAWAMKGGCVGQAAVGETPSGVSFRLMGMAGWLMTCRALAS
jgi:hypothetical protein